MLKNGGPHLGGKNTLEIKGSHPLLTLEENDYHIIFTESEKITL